MEIIHAKKINTHGGSIRVYASMKNKFKINKSVNSILKFEKNSLIGRLLISLKKKLLVLN